LQYRTVRNRYVLRKTGSKRMTEVNGYYLEDLEIGQSASFGKTITEADVVMFAGVSGDINPIHINDDYAKKTMFHGRIAHGILTAGVLSAVIGTRLPGPGSIYLSQELKFKAPVRIGDTVQAKVTVNEILLEKKQVVLNCVCTVGKTTVIEGEAHIMVPHRP